MVKRIYDGGDYTQKARGGRRSRNQYVTVIEIKSNARKNGPGIFEKQEKTRSVPGGPRKAPNARQAFVHDNVDDIDFACRHGPREPPLRLGGPGPLTQHPLPLPRGLGLAWSILIS